MLTYESFHCLWPLEKVRPSALCLNILQFWALKDDMSLIAQCTRCAQLANPLQHRNMWPSPRAFISRHVWRILSRHSPGQLPYKWELRHAAPAEVPRWWDFALQMQHDVAILHVCKKRQFNKQALTSARLECHSLQITRSQVRRPKGPHTPCITNYSNSWQRLHSTKRYMIFFIWIEQMSSQIHRPAWRWGRHLPIMHSIYTLSNTRWCWETGNGMTCLQVLPAGAVQAKWRPNKWNWKRAG